MRVDRFVPFDKGMIRTSLFGLAQFAMVLFLVVALVHGRRQDKMKRGLPQLRPRPRVVTPLFDRRELISDEQLVQILDRLRPRSDFDSLRVNHVDHALRMWGRSIRFEDSNRMSGPEMFELLTDDRSFRRVLGDSVRPLMIGTTDLKVRTQEGAASSSHTDHILGTLVEIGTPMDQALITRDGIASVDALMRSALQRFSLNQREIEWTAAALVLCAVQDIRWRSAEGQEISLDRIARRMMRRPLGEGCCYGGHRLYTLTLMLRVDAESALLTPSVREQIHEHLLGATRLLHRTQHADGYWNDSWAGGPSDDELEPMARRLLATGHALEWWAQAPAELHPPRENLVRAAQWLVREILAMEPETVAENYTFLTHAGRALALWRGHFPDHLYQKLSTARRDGNV